MSSILFKNIDITDFSNYKKCPFYEFILLNNLDIFNSYLIAILIVKLSMKMNKKLNEVSLIEYSTRSSHLLKLTSFSLIAQTADCLWSF